MKNSALLLLVLSAGCSLAQPDTSGFVQTLTQARQLSAQQHWVAAADAWQRVVNANPVNDAYWQALATARFNAGNYKQAVSAYQKKFYLLANRDCFAPLDMARSYTRMGNADSALYWLGRSMALGYRQTEDLSHQTEFSQLAQMESFRKLIGWKDVSKLSRNDGWRYDIDFLVQEVKRRGFSVPRTITKEDFEVKARRIQASIPKLTNGQLTVELMKLMVLLGDGHSMVYGFWETPALRQTLPLEWLLCEEGLFITAADQRFKAFVGSQVVAIENQPIGQVLKTLRPLVNSDNDRAIGVMGLMRMRHVGLLHVLGLAAQPTQLMLTLRDDQGRSRQVTFPADCQLPSRKLWDGLPDNWVSLEQLTPTPKPIYLRNPYQPYWFEQVPGTNTVYFQYNRVANMATESFDEFCQRLFTFIEHEKVDKLVIDMRFNNGGDAGLLRPLIHGLIRCEKLNKPRSLYVIIGRRTYSAAQIAATQIEQHTSAIFVGLPTGSSPNFVGEDVPTQLPYSQLMISISDRYWQSAAPNDTRQWIAPAWYVPLHIKALKANRDEELELILKEGS